VAVFERHDSAVVIAAFDQSVDWEAGNDRIDVALIFTAGESATPLVHRKRQREPRGVFVATLPRRPTLLSFELRSPVLGRAARARYGLRLQPRDPLRLTMSDLLVLTRADALPQTLEQAISSACGSLRARGGKRFGLYWEVYGLGPDGEPVEFSIAMYKVGKGELRSLEDLPAGAASALQLEWEEVAPAGTDIWGRAVVVELPADLSPGLYVVCLTLSTFGREPVQTARALYVGS
ncbi:MAG: hypothetical protein JSU87_03260, partial [Gemmatimonadota bacterium]